MNSILIDILLDVSWREVAKKYFSKSSLWFYDKMSGKDGGFTQTEKDTLKSALYDLSNRIRVAADKI